MFWYTDIMKNFKLLLYVMALNTWGMPEKLGSQFKKQRMDAIAKEISKGEFDVYLLDTTIQTQL